MFDRPSIRFGVAIAWVLLFAAFWALLNMALPGKAMARQLNNIQTSITQEDWTEAKIQMEEFEETWRGKRLYIQLANGSEEVTTFEHTMAQFKTFINLNDDDALDIIGELREMAKGVTTVFPGP